jgi:hypothetical protein
MSRSEGTSRGIRTEDGVGTLALEEDVRAKAAELRILVAEVELPLRLQALPPFGGEDRRDPCPPSDRPSSRAAGAVSGSPGRGRAAASRSKGARPRQSTARAWRSKSESDGRGWAEVDRRELPAARGRRRSPCRRPTSPRRGAGLGTDHGIGVRLHDRVEESGHAGVGDCGRKHRGFLASDPPRLSCRRSAGRHASAAPQTPRALAAERFDSGSSSIATR